MPRVLPNRPRAKATASVAVKSELNCHPRPPAESRRTLSASSEARGIVGAANLTFYAYELQFIDLGRA